MKLDPEKEQLMRKITGNKIAKSKQSHLKTPSPSLFPRATVHLSQVEILFVLEAYDKVPNDIGARKSLYIRLEISHFI